MMEEEHLDRLAERLLNRAIDVDVAFPKRYNTRDKKLYVCYKRIVRYNIFLFPFALLI